MIKSIPNKRLKIEEKETVFGRVTNDQLSGDIILFPDEYNSILIRTEINVPEIPKMNAVNK